MYVHKASQSQSTGKQVTKVKVAEGCTGEAEFPVDFANWF